MEADRNTSTQENSELMAVSIPTVIAEISSIIKDLKDIRVMIPATPRFNLSILSVQKTDESWKMTVDYHKLNWVLPLIAVLYQMRFHCLGKLTYSLISGMQPLIWQMAFPPYLSMRSTGNVPWIFASLINFQSFPKANFCQCSHCFYGREDFSEVLIMTSF